MPYPSNGRPGCFGDPQEYSPTDRQCAVCQWRHSCAAVATSSARSNTSQYQRQPSNYTPQRRGGPSRMSAPSSADYEEREQPTNFFTALTINGALAGLGAGLREAVYAVDDIPRMRYEDPLAYFMQPPKRKRKKRRIVEEYDDDEDSQEE